MKTFFDYLIVVIVVVFILLVIVILIILIITTNILKMNICEIISKIKVNQNKQTNSLNYFDVDDSVSAAAAAAITAGGA